MIQKSHFWVYSQRKWKQDPGKVAILPYLFQLIHNSEDMETTQVSIKDEWMKKWWDIYIFFSRCSVAKSCPTLWPHGPQHVRPPCPSPSPEVCPFHVNCINDAIQPSHPLTSSFPSALNLCQHQGLFQWVGYSHQVTIKSLHLKH